MHKAFTLKIPSLQLAVCQPVSLCYLAINSKLLCRQTFRPKQLKFPNKFRNYVTFPLHCRQIRISFSFWALNCLQVVQVKPEPKNMQHFLYKDLVTLKHPLNWIHKPIQCTLANAREGGRQTERGGAAAAQAEAEAEADAD